MSELIEHLTDVTLELAIAAPGVMLLDFWAPWCGPCKMLAPLLEEMAGEYAGSVRVTKLDVEQYKDAYERFGIRGIPTLIVFKDGEEVARQTGLLTKTRLALLLDKQL